MSLPTSTTYEIIAVVHLSFRRRRLGRLRRLCRRWHKRQKQFNLFIIFFFLPLDLLASQHVCHETCARIIGLIASIKSRLHIICAALRSNENLKDTPPFAGDV